MSRGAHANYAKRAEEILGDIATVKNKTVPNRRPDRIRIYLLLKYFGAVICNT